MSPVLTEQPNQSSDQNQLDRVWRNRRGVTGWLSVTTHQQVGNGYIITAFFFLLLGCLEALLMRLQLAAPENTFLGPSRYNQAFTMHGTTMMFLFAVPVMEGMGIYLVPLMLGTRNVA